MNLMMTLMLQLRMDIGKYFYCFHALAFRILVKQAGKNYNKIVVVFIIK